MLYGVLHTRKLLFVCVVKQPLIAVKQRDVSSRVQSTHIIHTYLSAAEPDGAWLDDCGRQERLPRHVQAAQQARVPRQTQGTYAAPCTSTHNSCFILHVEHKQPCFVVFLLFGDFYFASHLCHHVGRIIHLLYKCWFMLSLCILIFCCLVAIQTHAWFLIRGRRRIS